MTAASSLPRHFRLDIYAVLRIVCNEEVDERSATSSRYPRDVMEFARFQCAKYDVVAQPVFVGAPEFRFVSVPAAVGLCDGKWSYVTHVSRSHLQIVNEWGETLDIRVADIADQLTGEVIEFFDGRPSRRLVANALSRVRGALVTAIVAFVLTTAAYMAVPIIVGYTIDSSLQTASLPAVATIAVVLFVFGCGMLVYSIIRSIALRFLRISFERRLTVAVVWQILHVPLRNIARRSVGMVAQDFSGIYAVRDLISERFVVAAVDVLTAFAAIVYVCSIDIVDGAIIFGIALSAGVAVLTTTNFHRALRTEELVLQARSRDELSDIIVGAHTFRSAVGADRWVDRCSRTFAKAVRTSLQRERLRVRTDVAVDVFRMTLVVFVLIRGVLRARGGESTIGFVIASLQFASMAFEPFVGVARLWVATAVARTQAAPLARLLGEAESTRVASPATLRGRTAISIRGAWFRYNSHRPWVISDLHLDIATGEHRRIGGRSGAGKTTTLRLVAGALEPEHGIILIDGRSAAAAHGMCLFLPQNARLFSGSIYDNLRLFSGNAPQTRLLEAAEQTGLLDWVDSLPMRWQTYISAASNNVSGGQRQLIMMTGVAASVVPILLLDEPFSMLDTVTTQRLTSLPVLKRRTLVYASHAETFLEAT